MSSRKRSERMRQSRPTNAIASWLRQHPNAGRYLRTAAIGLFLVGSVAVFAIVLITQAAPSNTSTPQTPAQAGVGTTTQQPGSATQQPGNTTPHPSWVGIKSSQSSDIIAAARATAAFQNVMTAQTSLGNALRNGTLGTPVLVHAYRPTLGMLDTWVIPVRQGGDAHVVALLDFAYDKAQQRLHATTFAGPFAPGDPPYGQPFPRLAADEALSQMQTKRQITEMAGAQPQLVYFPIDLDKTTGPHASVQWTGGGQFADTAIWLVHGADTRDYFVGNDGQVYTADQLPLSPQAGQ